MILIRTKQNQLFSFFFYNLGNKYLEKHNKFISKKKKEKERNFLDKMATAQNIKMSGNYLKTLVRIIHAKACT